MKCPVCDDVRMREIEKNSVLIDVCPDCKGVWLDRGELDKLMDGVREMKQELESWERTSYEKPQQPILPAGSAYQAPPQTTYDQRGYDSHKGYSKGYNEKDKRGGYPYNKKKKSVLDVFGDLFD